MNVAFVPKVWSLRRAVWLRRFGIGLLILFAVELLARVVVAPLDLPLFVSDTGGRNLGLIPGAHGRVHMYGRTIEVSVDAEGHRKTVGAGGSCARHRLDLIGDSQVFGWGLSDSETIASRLQARLGPDWRVVNHGIPEIGPLQYARVLQTVPNDAEVLIVFTEVNDLWDTYDMSRNATRCGFLTESWWPRSNLICPVLNLRALQAGFAAYDELTRQRALAPIGFDATSGIASRILALHVREMFVKSEVRVHPHLHFTVLPFDGRFSAEARQDYFPPPNPNTPRYFDDDYDMIAAFARPSDPRGLYLPRDPHLSPRGASLFADQVAANFVATSNPSATAAPGEAECGQ
jgi:hypothetical protein